MDYIDRLNEGVCLRQLLRGLRVGLALSSALAEPASPIKVDPLGDDGGYLAGLVASCRERLWSLPSAAAIQQQARTAATRCSEALAYTHTAAEKGRLALGATRSLRHRRIHAMIVYGVAGYYAASAVRGSLAASIAPRRWLALDRQRSRSS